MHTGQLRQVVGQLISTWFSSQNGTIGTSHKVLLCGLLPDALLGLHNAVDEVVKLEIPGIELLTAGKGFCHGHVAAEQSLIHAVR